MRYSSIKVSSLSFISPLPEMYCPRCVVMRLWLMTINGEEAIGCKLCDFFEVRQIQGRLF